MLLYNTLTKMKEPFEEEKNIYMYVCGLTPYDHAHIGHARTMVAFDLLKRYLLWKGYNVFHIQNITDVDDKIIKRAKETNKNPLEIAEYYHNKALEGFDKLNIIRADVYPKVSEHIGEIIEMVKKIMENGFAYKTNSGVYFDVEKYQSTFGDYGKLSNQKIDEIREKHRIEHKEDKKDPIDFALWKNTDGEIIEWDSPFGKGRPGWHIECSAMSLKYSKGKTLHIHGGAQDLIFPHHENEIAQSQAYNKKPFVKFFLHSGFLTINGEKMSKSLGNFITLEEALKTYHPMGLRLFFLTVPYYSPIDFNEEKIKQYEQLYNKIKKTYITLSTLDNTNTINKELQREWSIFIEGLENNLDSSKAVAALNSLISKINQLLLKGRIDQIGNGFHILKKMLYILGIKIEYNQEKALSTLLELRKYYRERKMFEVSDKIREIAKKNGIIIEDIGTTQRVSFE